MKVIAVTEDLRPLIDCRIADEWAGPYIVSRGVLHDTRTHSGFAVTDERLLGYLLYVIEGGECEITVLESLTENIGVGTALLDAVEVLAKTSGCRRLWLITTNDNTRALRWYQKRGFRICAVRLGAVKEARRLKPGIPAYGNDGIAIEHEIELGLKLT